MRLNKPTESLYARFNVYNFQTRLFSVVCFVGVCLLLVLGRMFYLQVWEAKNYEELAARQQQRTIVLESRRSAIYDQRGRLLATSIKVDSAHVLPPKVSAPEKAAQQLSPLLDMSEKEILEKLKSPRSFNWLKRQLDPVISQKIRQLQIPGIEFIEEYKRYYPLGDFAGPLLGFTGIDSQGLEGLEHEYHEELQGEKNKYVIEQDGTHRIIPYPPRSLVGIRNTEGPNLNKNRQFTLHLTLDSSIQYFAEKALKSGIEERQAQRGIAIVMESRTGAVLALAHVPGFDPNHFQRFPRSHYLNYAISSGYEPGSILKPITIATAIEENIIEAGQEFFCENGSFQVADRVIHDIQPHGWLTVQQIIQKSSNICTSKIGLLIGKEIFFDYLRRFGFGRKMDIGLSAEAIGKVPPPENWTIPDHASISFGHGILVSPMQLLVAINVMASGGMLVTPYIVDHLKNEEGETIRMLTDAEGKEVKQFGPRKKMRVLTAKTAEKIRQFMITVTEEGGTGKRSAIPGVTVAGKTGTTEMFDHTTQSYSKEENIASFIGIVPAGNPFLTILVLIESPKTSSVGGVVAAPIFREIAERSLIFFGKGFKGRLEN